MNDLLWNGGSFVEEGNERQALRSGTSNNAIGMNHPEELTLQVVEPDLRRPLSVCQ
jgi:hypothetical protein